MSEALDILQLRPLQGRMIGGAGTANGLSPGQRRILTVAVEAGSCTRSLQSSTWEPSGHVAHVRAQLEDLQVTSTGYMGVNVSLS